VAGAPPQAVPRVYHVTRMVPTRAAELVDGGSMYWVIRGAVLVRQRIEAVERYTDEEGIGRCKLVFDPELVPVRPVPRRAFQGWRYLSPPTLRPTCRRARPATSCRPSSGPNWPRSGCCEA
jgi:hypothetical protein